LTSTDECTRRQNPEDHHRHRRENLKSHNILKIQILPQRKYNAFPFITKINWLMLGSDRCLL
jgi:hypothetical protein